MENGDRGWRGLYQAGGIGMIAAGLLVLVTLPLIPTLIPSLAPATMQSGLESIQSQRLLFGTTWGVDIPLRLSLIGLSNSYASANPAGQAAYVATAQLAMDLANIGALIATFVQFAAVILVSYAMLRDTRFRRSAAYVGMACGILAFLVIPTFVLGSQLSGLFNLGGFVLLVIWSVMVG